MSIRAFALSLLILVAASLPARAYTPESGIWWNPDEPGTGVVLEIQDNFLFLGLFVGSQSGNPDWYTSSGFLSGSGGDKVFQGLLDFSPGAQCIGCGYRAPTTQLGVGGSIRLVFDPDDQTRATMTIGGRTTQIERFHFYFKRPEDEQRLPGVAEDLTRLLGEWNVMLDYSRPSTEPASYRGEVLVFRRLASDSAGDFIDGCRPVDSQVGGCGGLTNPQAVRYAVAEYVASSRTHVIVVNNDANTFLSLFVELGSNDFAGEFAVYTRGTNPTLFLPANGFRTASRTFVEGFAGPSRKDEAMAPGLPLTIGAEVNKSTRDPQVLAELHAVRQRLEAQLLKRAASN